MRSSRSTPAGEFPVRIPGANGLIQAVRYLNFRITLKVHKRENFLGSNLEIYTFS